MTATTASRIISRLANRAPDFPDHRRPGRLTPPKVLIKTSGGKVEALPNRADLRAADRRGHHLAKWDKTPAKRRNRRKP